MEIQTVKPVEFYKRKGIAIDNAVEEKYKSFFLLYNCFSDNAVVVIQPSTIFKPFIKRTLVKKENKTVKRHMLGILNVINTENYRKLLLKTKIFITSDNIKEIFTEILEKCTFQIFYLQIYTNLMKDLMNSFSDYEKNIALSVINDFAEKFLNNEYILTMPQSADAYHDFCTVQKNKMIIMAKNAILIEYMKNTDFIKVIDMVSYSTKIYEAFIDNISTNVEIADLLLHLMIELAKAGAVFDKHPIECLKTSKKIKFLIEDLLKLY